MNPSAQRAWLLAPLVATACATGTPATTAPDPRVTVDAAAVAPLPDPVDAAEILPDPRPDASTPVAPDDAPSALPDPVDVLEPALDAALETAVDPVGFTPDSIPDGAPPPVPDAAPPPTTMGAVLRVTASTLNLRSGPGTTNAIVTTMPCGTTVTALGTEQSGWWNVRFGTYTGWASGMYLVAQAAFVASTCTGGVTPSPTPAVNPEVTAIFDLARQSVGYSYYWGHGSWGTDGLAHGTCSGSCPSCTHTGSYGADCSGFVAKAWQIPTASPVTTDEHPYSTYTFYNSNTHWSHIDRATTQPADALTYNASGAGHIVLVESGSDPWGSLWLYEARGCSYGIVHNLRSVGSAYIAIRRDGL